LRCSAATFSRVAASKNASDPTAIRPCSGYWTPTIDIRVVDLPLPDGPSSVNSSPLHTVTETSSSARCSPNCSTSDSTWIAQGTAGLPKGISAPTLGVVVDAARTAAGGVTAATVAARAGVSRDTARRYLDYLASLGSVELTLRYGTTGRPEHLYRRLGPLADSA
jgi:hypothetical protein